MANTVEELPLYSEVLKFWDAVTAIQRLGIHQSQRVIVTFLSV
jgi:hypothetical protein